VAILPDFSRRCPVVDPDDGHLTRRGQIRRGKNVLQARRVSRCCLKASPPATQELAQARKRVVIEIDVFRGAVLRPDRCQLAGNFDWRCADDALTLQAPSVASPLGGKRYFERFASKGSGTPARIPETAMTDRTTFLSQRRRLRRVLTTMSIHAQQACSGEIVPPLTLAELAEEACWSKEHFVRVWTRIFGEPPVATAWRIRLDASVNVLVGGATVSHAAECAGFSSVQAFCRAFRRQFGMPAREYVQSRRLLQHDDIRLRIVTIREPISCIGIPYTGTRAGIDDTFDVTLNTVAKSGGRWRRECPMFAIWPEPPKAASSTEQRIAFSTAVAEHNLPAPIRNLSKSIIPAGHYVRLDHYRLQSEQEVDEWLFARGWMRRDGPSVQEFITDPVRTIPSRRREGLLIPVVR
jgi:AraC family transcriptional regulator